MVDNFPKLTFEDEASESKQCQEVLAFLIKHKESCLLRNLCIEDSSSTISTIGVTRACMTSFANSLRSYEFHLKASKPLFVPVMSGYFLPNSDTDVQTQTDIWEAIGLFLAIGVVWGHENPGWILQFYLKICLVGEKCVDYEDYNLSEIIPIDDGDDLYNISEAKDLQQLTSALADMGLQLPMILAEHSPGSDLKEFSPVRIFEIVKKYLVRKNIFIARINSVEAMERGFNQFGLRNYLTSFGLVDSVMHAAFKEICTAEDFIACTE